MGYLPDKIPLDVIFSNQALHEFVVTRPSFFIKLSNQSQIHSLKQGYSI